MVYFAELFTYVFWTVVYGIYLSDILDKGEDRVDCLVEPGNNNPIFKSLLSDRVKVDAVNMTGTFRGCLYFGFFLNLTAVVINIAKYILVRQVAK